MSKALAYQQALEIFQAQQTLNPYVNEQDSVWSNWYNGLAAEEQQHLSQIAGIVDRVLNEAMRGITEHLMSTESLSLLTSEVRRRFLPSSFLAAIGVEKPNISFTYQGEETSGDVNSSESIFTGMPPDGDYSEQESRDVLEIALNISRRQPFAEDVSLRQWFEGLPSEDRKVLHDSTEIVSDLVPKVLGYYLSVLNVSLGFLSHDFIQDIEPIRYLWKELQSH